MLQINVEQRSRLVGRLRLGAGWPAGARIAVLGLAFKPGTDDMRDASSLVLAARLLAEGADVCAYDPVVNGAGERLHGVIMCASAEEAVGGADAAVLVTEWSSIVGLDWEGLRATMRSPVLIDGRNALDPNEMAAAGYTFEGIGRIPS